MNTGRILQLCAVFVPFVITAMSAASPRPYLRSNLARTVYDRMMTDERLRTMNLSKMYEVDELALEEGVRQCFMQLSCDEDTQKFLDNCFEQSEWLITQIWHAVAKSFLGMFMTQTSVNGLLNRGRMFVWSQDQAKQLLGAEEDEESGAGARSKNEKTHDELDGGKDAGTYYLENEVPFEEGKPLDPDERERISSQAPSYWLGERLLDLGAGDGHVTQVLASGAMYVDVTEASPVMRRRLRDLGYRVLDTWKWMDETESIRYDVITALNLLDRCDTPRTLLRDIHKKLTDHGSLVIALVLPFCPYVETGSADNLPSENLGISGSTTEEQVNSLATEVFPSLGFKLVKWTRLPYLCEGDIDQAFYWLSDVVLVLQKSESSLLGNNPYERFTDDDLLDVKSEL